MNYVSSRKQQLQNDSSNSLSIIAFIIIGLSSQFTDGSSFSVNLCNSFDNINTFNAAMKFLKLIQQLSCSVLEKQNAVLCHQMIPLSLGIAYGLKKRSQISY